MLDGRVKTLHPIIHGGLLGLRDGGAHAAQMAEHNIEPIDLLVVNLYPFESTVAGGALALVDLPTLCDNHRVVGLQQPRRWCSARDRRHHDSDDGGGDCDTTGQHDPTALHIDFP